MLLYHSKIYACSASSCATSTLINLFIFSIGALVSTYSYGSFAPVFVFVCLHSVFLLMLTITPLKGNAERKIFNRTSVIGFLAAGIAAIYANQFGDAGQLTSDPSFFYDFSSVQSNGLSVAEMKFSTEAPLAILIWREVYNFFSMLGLEKARYTGVAVNVIFIALSSVVALKMSRQIFGDDDYRFNRLMLLFSGCGMLWLYSGIHLRESFLFLSVVMLLYTWVDILSNPVSGRRLIVLGVSNAIGAPVLFLLRNEFVLLPILMLMSMIVSILLSRDVLSNRFIKAALFIPIISSVLFLVVYNTDGVHEIQYAYMKYMDHMSNTHGDDSLAFKVILNQPFAVRMIVGFVYLYLSPIPFWVGVQLDSAYHLFKSFNVVMFYFVMPLVVISISKLFKISHLRKASLLFLLIFTVGFSLLVSATSFETRHLGIAFSSLFVIACLPDLRVANDLNLYKIVLLVLLAFIFVVHVSWVLLKFM